MRKIGTMLAALVLGVMAMASAASADNKVAVQSLYDFLSNPGSMSHADALRANLTSDWQSIGDYSTKNKSVDAFVGQLGHFAKLIPDLTWNVEEMLEAGNRVIVRGRASGTPNGPLFGVDGKGKSFAIMSIDIHTIQDGKIATTYHVEDWAGALRQLNAE